MFILNIVKTCVLVLGDAWLTEMENNRLISISVNFIKIICALFINSLLFASTVFVLIYDPLIRMWI